LARTFYEKSLAIDPDYGPAHYNLAVLDWGKDWPRVVEHLKKVVAMEPQNAEARRYLDIAQTHLAGGREK
jgi:hypothetical protein